MLNSGRINHRHTTQKSLGILYDPIYCTVIDAKCRFRQRWNARVGSSCNGRAVALTERCALRTTTIQHAYISRRPHVYHSPLLILLVANILSIVEPEPWYLVMVENTRTMPLPFGLLLGIASSPTHRATYTIAAHFWHCTTTQNTQPQDAHSRRQFLASCF